MLHKNIILFHENLILLKKESHFLFVTIFIATNITIWKGMMYMKRYIAFFLAIVLLFTIGCQERNVNDNAEDATLSAGKVDKKNVLKVSSTILDSAGANLTPEVLTAVDEMFMDANETDENFKRLNALMLATDISIGQLGMVNQDLLLYMAGKALEGYPEHPLVLNNAASVLFDSGYSEEAISLYQEAVKASPQNPVFLTNLANAYISTGDFAMAEKYAKQSLSADSSYSAAYQVLTTVYLERKEDMLAAETMIKSTRNCFNDVSILHFTSYLYAVESLDAEDEYPLKEALLDELYQLAKQDAEAVNDSVDTPGEQIKLKPFPQISSLDAFIGSIDSLNREAEQLWDKAQQAGDKFVDSSLVRGEEKYINGQVQNANGSFPVRSSLKQIFAFKVLSSFYKHRYKQENARFEEEYAKLEEEYLKRIEDIEKLAFQQMEEHQQAANYYLMGEQYKPSANENIKALDRVSSLMDEMEDVNSRYFPLMYNIRKEHYDEIKKITEEYWLKTGGMLKYITDESTYQHLIADRDFTIYTELYKTVAGLGTQAFTFKLAEELSFGLKNLLGKNSPPAVSAANAEMYMQPDVEYPPLPVFKEKNDNTQDINLGCFSVSYSNNELSVKFTTPISTHLKTKNLYDGRTTTANAYGVNPGVGALVKGVLGKERYKKLQETVWKRYNIGLPDNPEEGKTGRYYTRDSKGRIVDRGSYNVKEASIGLPGIDGASIEVSRESMRSFITGVTEVQKSKSIGFSNLKMEQK